MSGQPSLITLALDAEVQRPGGIAIQRQFYRDKAAQGSGTYKAMDENGNIEIVGGPGMGFIDGGGTLNFIPKFTPDGNTIGNSSLFDNGNIGYGTILPNSVAAFDIVSTTKGMLFPRMTTVQRDAIVTGASTDGLFIYNISTEKFNFWNQTLGAWESIDTSTGGDVSGSGTTDFIPRWTDGPNSVLGDSIIRDNGTIAAVNRAVVAGTIFAIQGADAGAVNFTLQTYNSTPTMTFGVRNDGRVGINTSSPAALIHGVGLSNTDVTYSLRLDSSTSNNILAVGNGGSFGFNNDVLPGAKYFFLDTNGLGVGDTLVVRRDYSTSVYAGSFTSVLVVNASANSAGELIRAFGATDSLGSYDLALAWVENVGASEGAWQFTTRLGGVQTLGVRIKGGLVSMPNLQTGNAGLVSGDLYVDTAVNILANGDLHVARVV